MTVDFDSSGISKFGIGSDKTAMVPIMMLSSIDEPIMKAEALDAGADDYAIKLPGPVEFIARIRALLRRCNWNHFEQS